MKEHEDDPEKFSDLQHTMAQSYSDSPEHRKTWLQEMARRHRENGNLIEAAMCYAHIAALVAQILNKNKDREDKILVYKSNLRKNATLTPTCKVTNLLVAKRSKNLVI